MLLLKEVYEACRFLEELSYGNGKICGGGVVLMYGYGWGQVGIEG